MVYVFVNSQRLCFAAIFIAYLEDLLRIESWFEVDNLFTSIYMPRDAYCTLLFRKESLTVTQYEGKGFFM